MTDLSREIQRLDRGWSTSTWPKWLDWIEIDGLRGWSGQRLDFHFPIVALVGENGTGKSTVLQAIASIYRAPTGHRSHFASEFFPSTAWERVSGVKIRYSVREGTRTTVGSIRKPTERWKGNPDRSERPVRYIDLRRSQPIIARPGFSKLAKARVSEAEAQDFQDRQVERLSSILGRQYERARHSRTNVDSRRWIPVTEASGNQYSGFHQGAGETTVFDLLRVPIPDTSIVLIDEIETSLHPRAQRRLVRDLAVMAREEKLQIVLSTHSPYVLEELPVPARMQIIGAPQERQVVIGVSADFAMTMMDLEPHPELEIFVEDRIALIMLVEILAKYRPGALRRTLVTPYGSAGVGRSLGRMAHEHRFTGPTLVLLDGDQDESDGCLRMPGTEAPERVVFQALEGLGWPNVAERVSRSHADLVDAARRAMSQADHRSWLREAGNAVLLGGEELWRTLVSVWIDRCTTEDDVRDILDAIDEQLENA